MAFIILVDQVFQRMAVTSAATSTHRPAHRPARGTVFNRS